MNDLALRESIKDLTSVTNKIDSIIKECIPITQTQKQGICEALVLAKGISQLRKIFYNDKNIIATLEAMIDSKLGFQTDRSSEIIEKNKKYGKKKIVPYTYNEIAECCIEALIKGYRLTDNEFSIIAGNFYAAKNGKYRKIIEFEDLTDFTFANTPPVYKIEARLYEGKPKQVQFAEVQCYASLKIKGKPIYLGYNPENQETKENVNALIFKIRVNEYMGDDAIVGKALSKLFTRVLTRISGKIIEEATANDQDQPTLAVKDITQESNHEKISDSSKISKTLSITPFERIKKSFFIRNITESEILAYFGVNALDELDCDDGMRELQRIVTDIEGGVMTIGEFKKISLDRFSSQEKLSSNVGNLN